MIIETKELKDVCAKVLTAVDNNELSAVTETLELVANGNFLCMNVTNREYFVSVKLPVGNVGEFHATVNAVIFLKLISAITVDSVEFTVVDNTLVVKGNGTYTLPLIFDGEELLELPRIEIENVTNEFPINSDILHSILAYNSKELQKGNIVKPVQKLYYMDSKGAITFTTGACVNEFMLKEDIHILLNSRLVKLFKLFEPGEVSFKLGYDTLTDDTVQTKVEFSSDKITLTAILSCDDSLLQSVPAEAIRGRANDTYPYAVTVSKDALVQAINRLLLFSVNSKDLNKTYSKFEFSSDSVVIYDSKRGNKEVINYNNTEPSLATPYEATLDLNDLKLTLDACTEPYLILYFGNEQAFVLSRAHVKNVIPECCVDSE